jgi:amino acid adenylation domain-containing protein
MSLLPLIERQMRARPDALAIVHGDRRFTYRQVEEAAASIAQGLRREGVQPGSLIAIYLNRSPELLATLLAIWQVGAAYLPLDPEHPSQRTAFMTEDSGVPFILSEPALLASVPRGNARVLSLQALLSDAARKPLTTATADALPADSLAYVIYTSGSTGKPKGAMISHRSLANTIHGLQRDLQLQSSDVMLASNSIAFDISGQELYLPLISGARIHLVERDLPADGARLSEVLHDAGITIMMGLSTSYRLLLAAGWQGDPNLQLTVGGETLSLELARLLAQRCRALWNHYGPTETSICATSERIDAGVSRITLGRPLANVRIYVLDKHRQPVPRGSMGEIYIGGEGVGLGYLNRPTLTAASFLPDPFSAQPDATMYKTGDLGALLDDGRLDFLGRADEQIKIRGFRIELQEVEAALDDCPGVKAAVVRAIEFAPDDRRLIAFIVSAYAVESDQLRSCLRQRLPHYMVPSEYILLPSFPLMPNGKVDRRALDALRLQPVAVDHALPAASEVEAKLLRIWQTLLRVRSVRPSDNFFDLGGHSLLAVRMLAQVEKQIGAKVPISRLAEHPTVAKLADYIRHHAKDQPSLLVRLQPGASRPPLFFAHGIGGSLLTFRELVQALGEDLPVYGLTVPLSFEEMGGGGPGPDLIQRLAASYLEHIRAVDPHGPYQLAGHSSAALVLVEAANQLLAQGSEVHLLALLDSDIGQGPSREKPWKSWRGLKGFLQRNLEDLQQASRSGIRDLAMRKVNYYKLKFQLTLLQRLPRQSRHFSTAFVTEGYLALALNTFRPENYPGDVVHFLGQDEARSHNDPNLGWRPYLSGKLENVALPGDHQTIFTQPHVRAFGLQLGARLYSRADTPVVTPPVPASLEKDLGQSSMREIQCIGVEA